MKKIRKYDVILFSTIFVFSLLICVAFLQPHYTHDTYRIMIDGYENYSYTMFLREARPITALVTILAGKIHLPMEIYIIVSFIIGIALLSFSVFILYKIFKEKLGEISKIKKVALLMISYLIIFSYLGIEQILFLETCIVALGTVLTVLACKVIINKEEQSFLKALFILFIAVFCYQGCIALFPIILLAYYAIIEPLTLKEYIKITIKMAIMYGTLMLLTVLYSKFIFGGSRIQVGATPLMWSTIIKSIKTLVCDSLNVIPPYIHITIIILTSICIGYMTKGNYKEKIKKVLYYLFIIVASIAICMMPIICASGLELQPRMCMAYGSTIGISLLFIFWMIRDNNDRQIKNIVTYIVIFSIFTLNSILYIVLTNQHIVVNQHDKEIGNRIMQIISEYEERTGTEVTAIVAREDPNATYYLNGFIQTPEYNQRGISSWAVREIITYYTKPMDYVRMTVEQYLKFFKLKDYDEFSEEQVHIEGDTLYFYIY